ncbi:unnamed protein product [Rotaria sordida]|uniref:Peptide hydrolase n=1 Tax=Rotaria sordida TaxID=392033 RepID=A0A819CIV8_9BILA|nr:unnamed protein product [Rotaria sordida]CAF3816031.1 unnamed protein product [Rotaria sordida]
MKKHFVAAALLGFLFQFTYFRSSTAKSVLINDRYRNERSLDSTLAGSVRIDEAMEHLNELQRIATAANGTRAAGTPGFNHTLDYLTNYLSANTNFKIIKSFFHARDHTLKHDPILQSSIGGNVTNHTYSEDLSLSEFFKVRYSTSVNFSNFIPITVIPNVGCSDADWISANPPASGLVALVKRGGCSFIEQSMLATKFNVAALLLYNDGTSANRMSPMIVRLGQNNTIPAFSLSFSLGERLVNAAQNPSNKASVRIVITLMNDKPFPIGNICADTPTGDPTQTIVIGSHSDSVHSGPGINDNGSGSAANLAWAVAVARLFQTTTYTKYKYRLRFCWWGAEEIGLLGSYFHVAQAQNSTVVGERLTDYVTYLNFDMLGSPNFMFGIYDGRTAENDTTPLAIVGSYKISEVFRDWFIRQNLPWDFVEFGYGSDYAPFLIQGIPVGGLYSGSSEIKTQEQCDRYDQFLGQGKCGMINVDHDPCYHKACDSIQNINVFGYEKMIQAGAYTIESLARQPDLKSWLYS